MYVYSLVSVFMSYFGFFALNIHILRFQQLVFVSGFIIQVFLELQTFSGFRHWGNHQIMCMQCKYLLIEQNIVFLPVDAFFWRTNCDWQWFWFFSQSLLCCKQVFLSRKKTSWLLKYSVVFKVKSMLEIISKKKHI